MLIVKKLTPYRGGRRFSRGGSLQNILRSVRAVLCENSQKKDKDMKKAHITIAHGMLQYVTADVQYPKFKSFPTMADFINRADDSTVRLIKAAFQCTDDQSKCLVLNISR